MNKNRRGLSRLLPFLRPQLKTLLLCLLMVLLVNAAELAKPYILEVVIDRYLTAGRPDQGLDAVWVLALGYMACVALSSVLNVSEAVMVNRMGQSILMDIRRRVFNHIQHMSMKTLDHFSSGRLITRATNDVETLNELFSDVLVNLFKDVFMLLGIVVMMLWMNWRLALVAFAVVPLIALITILVRGRLRRNFVRLKALTGQINGFFSENMSGMRLVQIFRKEKEKHAEFDELNYGYYKAARLQVRMNSLMRPLVEVVNQLGIAILVWYGCGQIGLGTLEIGMLYAFTNYIKQFFEPINDLAEKYTTVSSAVVSTDRIFELLDDESQLEDTVTGKPLETVEGRVEFQHVWFAYEGENWVLKDVSFTIEPGQSVAFVGTTGAGKSTIISLISRFYDIQKGRILLDGEDVNQPRTNVVRLRQKVGMVFQKPNPFPKSIFENVAYGLRVNGVKDENLITEKVELALRRAALWNEVEDRLSSSALGLSGGQQQRLCIARALAVEPQVLLMDEPASALDPIATRKVEESIVELKEGLTIIIVTHSMQQAARISDRTAFFYMGRLVESDSTDVIFTRPSQKETEDYITGRFG